MRERWSRKKLVFASLHLISCYPNFESRNLLSVLSRLSPKRHFLTQKTEMGVMTQQTQHDQIGIKSVKTMPGVRVVIRLSLVQSDEFLDLVFTLSGDLQQVSHASISKCRLTS